MASKCKTSSKLNSAGPSKLASSKNISCDLKSVITFLQMRHEVISEYATDSEGKIKCLYFQDAHMKDFFNFYPDRICIDISYKYLDSNVFMYLFICEDPNGHCEIISLSLLLVDDSESLTWLLDTFKKHNPNWRRTKIIVADPELKQRDIIRICFPSPYILICFYHAHRSFKKYIECSNNLSALLNEQKTCAIELFKNMLLACNYAEFDVYYQQFLVLDTVIISYFREVWIPVQLQWQTGLDLKNEDVFQSLNGFLEHVDKAIRPVFHEEAEILEFVKKFFLIMSLKKVERSKIYLRSYPVLLYSRFSPEYQISQILTPYASKFVIQQLDLSAEINMDCSILSDNYVFNYFSSTVNASSSACSCQFFSFMFLPCRHIFAVRKMHSLCIFDDALCDYSWSENFYQSTVSCLQDQKYNDNDSIVPIDPDTRMSYASDMLEELAIILKGRCHFDFNSKIEVLNKLILSWKNNDDVFVKFEGIQDTFNNKIEDCDLDSDSYDLQKVDTNDLTMPNLSLESPGKSDESSFINLDTCPKTPGNKPKGWNFKSEILNASSINYSYLCRIICHTKEDCLEWLRFQELISSTMLCPTCNCEMTCKRVGRLSDGAIWTCSNITGNKKVCSKKCSVRSGSWFEFSSMTMEQILTFCYMWINGFSQNQIISETGVSSASYVTMNKFNQRVCEERTTNLNEGLKGVQTDSNESSSLELWLKINENEDTFLKFLHDAAVVYKKDSCSSSIC